MENYFRVRGLPYRFEPMQFPRDEKRLRDKVGVMQMPALQLADGRWMTDSTYMIQWLEEQLPQQRITPTDPLQRFISLLLEDYADEWLWRPAMHYRWYYPESAQLQSFHLADELAGGLPLPGALKRWSLRRRQRRSYTTGDGVTEENHVAIEQIYLSTLDTLQAILAQRSYLLGDRPSLADIGFSGPFFRHFALDPVPLAILRARAPAVLEWVARLWNAPAHGLGGDLCDGIPTDLGPLLDDVGKSYIPYLCANACAVRDGRRRFDTEINAVHYRGARYSRYRVACLRDLRRHFTALSEAVQAEARGLLDKHGCWEPLWRETQLPLLPGQDEHLPFRGDNKMIAANE